MGWFLFERFYAIFWLVYPAFVSFFMSAITYPLGFGKYLAGEEVFSHTVHDFFIACSWIHDTPYSCPRAVNESWIGPNGDISIFHSLVAFQITFFILSIIASTLPVPAGIFMPVFVLGGAFGRYTGRLNGILLTMFQQDIFCYRRGSDEGELAETRKHRHVLSTNDIVPCAGLLSPWIDKFKRDMWTFPFDMRYSGAAAFCGAVTHTVSVAVIVFELTGQLVLLIPVMVESSTSPFLYYCI
ncbi:unnamed protein product [Haemonchus placei]|uniref:HCO3_cotransp domain-containing protein n=1 Tax=Haemonchus placei TaxID=6290 RepID=A0A0N4WCC5_HAEPC|nr:unnamed protein product [Haemonchus placei]